MPGRLIAHAVNKAIADQIITIFNMDMPPRAMATSAKCRMTENAG